MQQARACLLEARRVRQFQEQPGRARRVVQHGVDPPRREGGDRRHVKGRFGDALARNKYGILF